ncbi:eukaryotic translation initiation factor-like [Olea europaea subsp. europaea]|uniref:Eukaryotic translation initiation factor-like n=1 Tax=Olea europaea subsp. europaea TaxID=158383 RepID=A0A8S0QA08_OLEEU|nr:eukaryotic translation initiation factor-like [Olea europaea subsp. europaea]
MYSATTDRCRLGLFDQERHGSLCQDVLKRKTASLLDEYFSLRLLDETLKCIGELKSGLSILKLSKRPFPWIEPVAKLLEYLLADKVFTKDMGTRSFLHATLLDDLA